MGVVYPVRAVLGTDSKNKMTKSHGITSCLNIKELDMGGGDVITLAKNYLD